MSVDLLAGTATDGWGTHDTLINIEEVSGSPFEDVLQADTSGSQLFGEGGRDTVIGGNGADLLVGGDGNDFVVGQGGDDVLQGGAGNEFAARQRWERPHLWQLSERTSD